MKERLLQIWEKFKAFWGELSRKVRIAVLVIAVLIVALIIFAAVYLNQTTYALLYNDLSTAEHARVLAVLSEQGIDARVEPSGAILVDEKDVDKARMQMATAGLPGTVYDEVSSPGLTATQTDKNHIYNNDLQKRLQTTIETFDEVQQAVVTINQPAQDSFAVKSDVTPPSASVVIIHRSGRQLTSQQISGILNMVKNSVAGLEEENISITDETGDLKTALALDANVNNAKLKLTEEVNSAARTRAMSMLLPIYGQGNVEVRVNSVLDTNEKTTERIEYNPLDPENPERNPWDYTEHDRQKIAGGVGIAEGVPGANDNVQTPEYGEQTDDLENTASYSSHDIYDYLVGSTKEQIIKGGLDITDATAAVVINSQGLADGERDRVTALVANATGIPAEKVTVQSFEFAGKPVGVPDTITQRFTPLQILGLVILGVIVLLVIILIIIMVMRKRKKEEEEQQEEVLYDEDGMPLIDLLDGEGDFEPITLIETNEQKLKAQIKDLADSDPEIVAQLLKTWISGGA